MDGGGCVDFYACRQHKMVYFYERQTNKKKREREETKVQSKMKVDRKRSFSDGHSRRPSCYSSSSLDLLLPPAPSNPVDRPPAHQLHLH